MVRRFFKQPVFCANYASPRLWDTTHGHLCPACFLVGLLEWAPIVAIFEEYLENSAVEMAGTVICVSSRTLVTLLLCKLHWLSVCFQVQFKCWCWLGYFRDHLSPISSACPTTTSRESMLWVSLSRELHLAGLRQWVFSAVAPMLWNISPPKLRLALSLLKIPQDFMMLVGDTRGLVK